MVRYLVFFRPFWHNFALVCALPNALVIYPVAHGGNR